MIKVLLAKLGLDVHDRGIITVAEELRDAGMEIIYIGNSFPNEIIRTAIQEDVDIIGISSLGGGHLMLGSEIIEKAKKENIKDKKAFVIGGTFTTDDSVKLKGYGFDEVFLPGATKKDIVSKFWYLSQELIL